MSDSVTPDRVVVHLREVREEMQCAAGHAAGLVDAQAVQGWPDEVASAIADLLEAERRARYGEALAVGAALVDVIVDGPPRPD